MNFAITLSDVEGLTRDIAGEPGVAYLDIENKDTSANNLYIGDVPPPDVVANCSLVGASKPYVLCSDLPNGIEIGMTCTGDNIAAGAQVTRVDRSVSPARIYLSKDKTADDSGSAHTFSAPSITDTTGITLVPGERREFTASAGDCFFSRPMRLVVLAGESANVVIRRGKR